MEVELTDEFILCERLTLYRQLWCSIEKEEEQLRLEFGIARGLACSKWTIDPCNNLIPNQMLPETMKLLHENFDMLLTQISRRRYYLQIAFQDVVKQAVVVYAGDDHNKSSENFKYWDAQLHLSEKRKKAKV